MLGLQNCFGRSAGGGTAGSGVKGASARWRLRRSEADATELQDCPGGQGRAAGGGGAPHKRSHVRLRACRHALKSMGRRESRTSAVAGSWSVRCGDVGGSGVEDTEARWRLRRSPPAKPGSPAPRADSESSDRPTSMVSLSAGGATGEAAMKVRPPLDSEALSEAPASASTAPQQPPSAPGAGGSVEAGGVMGDGGGRAKGWRWLSSINCALS